MSEYHQNELQIIQNNTMRNILNKSKLDKVPLTELHRLTELEPIEVRCDNLIKEYLKHATETNNPLITELITDYKRFHGGRNIKHTTVLDKFI